MRFDQPYACQSCPFRKGNSFLRKERAKEIADYCKQDKTFQCHNTVGRGKIAQHCVGYLVVQEKMRITDNHQMLRIAMRLGLYNPDKLILNQNIVDTLDEFVAQHDF